MEDEHILAQEILKKHNVSVSQLAEKANMADSTLYEYTGGRRKNMPLSVWRALYELTEDVRIPELIIGAVESFVIPMPKRGIDDCPQDTLLKLIQKRRKDLECEMAILDILADGKINSDDWKAIEQYRDVYPDAVKLGAQIYHTIMRQYEEAVKKDGK
jgi:transcriptional regulator with XRE-family HTH domain